MLLDNANEKFQQIFNKEIKTDLNLTMIKYLQPFQIEDNSRGT